jgi:hypothetical protein
MHCCEPDVEPREVPATDQAIRGDKPRVWDDPAVR